MLEDTLDVPALGSLAVELVLQLAEIAGAQAAAVAPQALVGGAEHVEGHAGDGRRRAAA
jgi:hypothetical protein